METAAIIGLTIPALASGMCAIFLGFWYYNRHDRAALMFAAAFAMCAIGFLLNHYVLPKESLANASVHNACYALGLGLLITGICTAFGRTSPLRTLTALGVGSVVAACLIQLTFSGLSTRIVVINAVHGSMMIVGIARLWGIWRGNWTGTAIIGSIGLCTVNFMVVSPMTVLGVHLGADTFFSSAYWQIMLMISIFSVLAMGGSLISVCATQRIAALREDAERDFLTGLKTRGAFEQAARQYCKSRSGEVAASVILIDIDHFKPINDTYGHATGDEVIRAVGAFLDSETRKSDLAGRVGGEEFCLLLPGTGLSGARCLAQRLKAQFESLDIGGIPDDFDVTASFGVAELSARTAFAEVYAIADSALYSAKSNGRNRIVCADPPARPGNPVTRMRLIASGADAHADEKRLVS